MKIENFNVCQRTWNDVINGKKMKFRWICFIVDEYVKTGYNDSIITQKACSSLEENYCEFDDYTIKFLKKSKFTTDSVFLNHRNYFELKCFPDQIIYSYSWQLGEAEFKRQFNDSDKIVDYTGGEKFECNW